MVKKIVGEYIANHLDLYGETIVKSCLKPGYKKKRKLSIQKTAKNLKIIESKKTHDKVKVVFFCSEPATWNAMKSAFYEAVKNPIIDEYLLTYPYKEYGENNDLNHEKYGKNIAYEFCKSFYDKTINTYDEEKKTWYDIESIRPDYVIFNTPYDKQRPPQYSSSVISQYSKVCLIPYTFCESIWTSRCAYNMEFLDYSYAVFVENGLHQQDLINVYKKFFKDNNKRIKSLGYPRFDLHHTTEPMKKEFSKVVMWLPRWTTDKSVDATTFFKYKDVLIKFFDRHKDIQFIMRPHPLMWRNFISNNEMSKQEESDIKRLFEEKTNFLLDESSDYLPIMKSADVIISDWSSLVVEEMATGNPIIYCGSGKGLDKEAKKRNRLFYKPQNEKQLMNCLKKLLIGDDPYKEKRKQYIEKELKSDGNTGKRIVEFIVDDYFDR